MTVNKKAEDKSVKVYIDIKSITGGYKEQTGEDNTSDDTYKTVNIEIKVGDKSKFTDSNVDKNSTYNKDIEIKGKAGVEVKLIITDKNGNNWTRTATIEDSSISFK